MSCIKDKGFGFSQVCVCVCLVEMVVCYRDWCAPDSWSKYTMCMQPKAVQNTQLFNEIKK